MVSKVGQMALEKSDLLRVSLYFSAAFNPPPQISNMTFSYFSNNDMLTRSLVIFKIVRFKTLMDFHQIKIIIIITRDKKRDGLKHICYDI